MKTGPKPENLKGVDNGRFLVLKRVTPTTKSKDTHWLIECKLCGRNMVATRCRIKRNTLRCDCQRDSKRKVSEVDLPKLIADLAASVAASDFEAAKNLTQTIKHVVTRLSRSSA